MEELVKELMLPKAPGDMQTLWIANELKPYSSSLLLCEGAIYTERVPPELSRVLFKNIAGVWSRPCTWIEVDGSVLNFIIPEIYPEYRGVFITTRAGSIFRHIPEAKRPANVSEQVITMIKSNYGV